LLLELLNSTPGDDAETQYRAVLAVGTLAHAQRSAVKQLAGDLGMGVLLQAMRGGGGKVAMAAVEVEALLK
jgi:hypothetical protein